MCGGEQQRQLHIPTNRRCEKGTIQCRFQPAYVEGRRLHDRHPEVSHIHRRPAGASGERTRADASNRTGHVGPNIQRPLCVGIQFQGGGGARATGPMRDANVCCVAADETVCSEGQQNMRYTVQRVCRDRSGGSQSDNRDQPTERSKYVCQFAHRT